MTHKTDKDRKPLSWQLALDFGHSKSEVTGMKFRFNMDERGEVTARIAIGLKGTFTNRQIVDKFWHLKAHALHACTFDIAPRNGDRGKPARHASTSDRHSNHPHVVHIEGALSPELFGEILEPMLIGLRQATQLMDDAAATERFITADDAAFVMKEWSEHKPEQWEVRSRATIEKNRTARAPWRQGLQQTTRISILNATAG